jgi:hypothetical protein
MTGIVKWLLVVIGGLIILYAILLFAGVLMAPVYLSFGLFPVIILLAGIGIVFLSLGFFSANKKD